jgi:hypothetical protein
MILSNMHRKFSRISFQSQLQHPLILCNEEAEAFIKNLNLLDYPQHQSEEIYDEIAGFVTVNVYSLYDTISYTEGLI